MEMSFGTMELQPPWATELLARNCKVARNIWSTSDLSEPDLSYAERSSFKSTSSNSANNSKDETSNKRCSGGGNGENAKSIDPVIGSSSRASKGRAGAGAAVLTLPLQQQTEKSSLMKNNSNASSPNDSKNKLFHGLKDVSSTTSSNSSEQYYDARDYSSINKSKTSSRSSFDDSAADNNEEDGESLIEYGPGIVRKLRSKYQSLAVRQNSIRPSLWRSASLENCLDLDQSQELATATPLSPSPATEKEFDDKTMTQTIVGSKPNDSPAATTRGRTTSTNAAVLIASRSSSNNAATNNKSDRMRRARSVDALHNIINPDSRSSRRRQHQQQLDEEILEKCKTVVTPKEEIVIIEVSKPNNISTTGAAILRLTSNNGSSDKRKLQLNQNGNGYYYRNNSSEKNYFYTTTSTRTNSTSFDSTGLVRGDSINSPEHELPPHDIVRETARLFEIHNSNYIKNAGGINNWRKVVGQALRLTNNKVQSSSNINSSPPPSSPVILNPEQPTTAVSSSTTVPMSDKSKVVERETTKGSSIIIPTSTSFSQVPITATTLTTSKNSPAGKQIGVIRPTVNGIKTTQENHTTSASPGLSPIILNASLLKGKPPLSPKPTNLFCTSSPKTLYANNNTSTTTTKSGSSENTIIEKTDLIAPKPGPRTLLYNVKRNSPEPVAAMQKNNNSCSTNNSSGLHQSNENGNDVTLSSSSSSAATVVVPADKLVTTSLKSEESESKSHFPSVTLKPVPLIFSTTPSSPLGFEAIINKASQNTNVVAQERENKEPVVTLVDNGNVNASSKNNNKSITNSTPTIMMTDNSTISTNTNGSSPIPRPNPIGEPPLPFQQVKSQLKRQPNVANNNNNAKREEFNSNNINSNANKINANKARNDKNLPVSSNNKKEETTPTPTTIESKAKVKETEVEKKKKINNNNVPKNKVQVEVIPVIPPTSVSASLSTTAAPTTSQSKSKPASTPQPIPQQSVAKSKQSAGRGPANGNDGIMVFNFTSRNKVPDYIEDDGLASLRSGFNNESTDDVDSTETIDRIDFKLIQFVGANIIINGKSSIQKKPKSRKLSISFNEGATTTFEYPSETSILSEETSGNNYNDGENNNNSSSSGNSTSNGILGQKTPNGIHGSVGGLGSYTPSKGSPSLYQLGTYKEKLVDSIEEKMTEGSGENTEDYLKPDTETTTWSNEIGAADILF